MQIFRTTTHWVGGDRFAHRRRDNGPSISVDYEASRIRRTRSTKAEIESRRDRLAMIVEAMQPMTVRQVFYQATVLGLIDKTEAGYEKVQTDLVHLRRTGRVPFDWLIDNTRFARKPVTFRSPEDAISFAAASYRKDLWIDAGQHVQVWLEKDALAGVLWPITSRYDVPLMVARGYASLSFLHHAACEIGSHGVPTFVYHLGDFDPSGVDAGKKIEETLREFAPDTEIAFKRLAVLPDQIDDWALPTRPTKTTDSRARNFGDQSVELDAIEPTLLRRLVEDSINQHLPGDKLRQLLIAEDHERERLRAIASSVSGTDPNHHPAVLASFSPGVWADSPR